MTDGEATHREAIRALVERFSFHSDRGQFAEVAACFAADGLLQWQRGEGRGPEEIAARLRPATYNPAIRFVRHHLTTMHIRLAPDLRQGTGRIYFFTISNAGADHGGVYADRYVCRDGEWLFAAREVRLDWQSAQSLYPRHVHVPLLFSDRPGEIGRRSE